MDTIFAPITNIISGSIFTIRISGSAINKCLKALGVNKKFKPNEIKHCKIFDENKLLLDEVMIAFFAAPNSFTGLDTIEISCHGSQFILKKIIKILSKVDGVRMAEPGEFSKIAFLNDKIDLIQAESIPDLIACETALQHQQALKQLNGEIGKIYENWRLEIIEISALIESLIDFPDEDLPQNIQDEIIARVNRLKIIIKRHLDDKNSGIKIKNGLSLAIIGYPNVGKSSLLNFFAKSEVAITSNIAGTTRDIIEIDLEISGALVRIADTAGIRNSKNKIEQEGIKRAINKAKTADIKILLFDDLKQINKIDKNIIDKNTIFVLNKIDLLAKKDLQKYSQDFIKISILKKQNLDMLLNILENKVKKMLPGLSYYCITNERHQISLNNIYHSLENFSLNKNIELASEDLRIAINEIALITGKIKLDDILDIIFSKFCIGK